MATEPLSWKISQRSQVEDKIEVARGKKASGKSHFYYDVVWSLGSPTDGQRVFLSSLSRTSPSPLAVLPQNSTS